MVIIKKKYIILLNASLDTSDDNKLTVDIRTTHTVKQSTKKGNLRVCNLEQIGCKS